MRQNRRARFDSKPLQPLALADYARHQCTGRPAGRPESFEIDMAREVLLAWTIEYRSKAMASNGLKRVAWSGARMAVVDDDSDAAVCLAARGYRANHVVSRRRRLNDFAVAVERQSSRGNEDATFDSTNVLANRKRVEELVCNEQQWLCWNILKSLVPMRIRYRFPLRVLQQRAGLDEMYIASKAGATQDAKCITRKRASPRTQFHVSRIGGRASLFPAIGKGCANQLTEHLADFRRRREVTGSPERIPRCIIISIARFHVGFERDWPLGRNPLAKRPLERRHATDAVPAVDSTRTRRPADVTMR